MIVRFIPCLLLAGCHERPLPFDRDTLLVIGGFVVFIYAVWRVDRQLEESGWRVDPAPHAGMSEPTSIQEQVAYEAEKGIKHGREE